MFESTAVTRTHCVSYKALRIRYAAHYVWTCEVSVKVQLRLCMPWRQWRSGCTPPHIPNLGTRRGWVDSSFTPGNHQICLSGPHRQSGRFGDERSLHLPGTEPRFLGCPASSQVAILTELPRLDCEGTITPNPTSALQTAVVLRRIYKLKRSPKMPQLLAVNLQDCRTVIAVVTLQTNTYYVTNRYARTLTPHIGLEQILGSAANYPTIHCYRGIKRMGAWSDHSPPSKAEMMNDACRYTCSTVLALMTPLKLSRHRLTTGSLRSIWDWKTILL